jgi:hypothetical protein
MVTKSGDATYAPVSSVSTAVAVSPPIPKAKRMSSSVWTGRTVATEIIGSGFYGDPRVNSNAAGTRVVVTRDTGHVLIIRVKVSKTTKRGEHRFTIIFADGRRTSLHYNQR